VIFERFVWRLQFDTENQNREMHDIITTHTLAYVLCLFHM
jgi:hypothetical protein